MLNGDANGVQFKDFCFESWREKHGSKPPWGPKDYVLLANAHKRFEDEESSRRAWTAFLATDEPFLAGHDPGKFMLTISRWASILKPRLRRRDKMQIDDEWKAKGAALEVIYKAVYSEVEWKGKSETEKRWECSRRFRERFPA